MKGRFAILCASLGFLAVGCDSTSPTRQSQPSDSIVDGAGGADKSFADRWNAAKAIDDPDSKDAALEEIAREALSAAQPSMVTEALTDITNENLRDSLASEMAPKLAKSGNSARALESARLIVDETLRDSILSKLAGAANEKKKPLAPETILENKFEGKATVELQVGEVHTLNIDSMFVPDVSHAQIIQAKIPGVKTGQVVVTVSREVATRLLKLGIADPAEHFRGKVLRVSGTVEQIKRPSTPSVIVYGIQVTDLHQLESISKP